jgi:ubiquinone/menaquinone biosynthesis C-methylase UbiE
VTHPADETRAVREQYAQVAAAYRTSRVHAQGPDLDALVELLAPVGTERIVDLGTGAGHSAVRVASDVAHVDAVDLVPEMLEQAALLAAERGVTNIAFHAADVRALPFADASMDGAVSRVSAHHWADVPAGIAEAARVVRPGGRIVIVDTVAPPEPALDSFINAVEILRDPSHGRDLTIGEWRRILEEAGCSVTDIRVEGIELEAADWFARSRTEPWREEAARALLRTATPAARETFVIAPDATRFSLIRGIVAGTRR